jgi:hypothetical protein
LHRVVRNLPSFISLLRFGDDKKQAGKGSWKMKRTVYILGAGFSSVVGIPTMKDFLKEAKNIAYNSDENDEELKKTLKYIDDLSKIKNYCKSDLFNIEEAFSLLEAEDRIQGSKEKHSLMVNLIKKVVEKNTPSMVEINGQKINNKEEWYEKIYNKKWYKIFRFLLAVFCLEESEHKFIKKKTNFEEQNDIITFNYDTLLENCLESINEYALEDCKIEFCKDVHLYKLHGCVKKNNIVPPTWAKYSIYEELGEIWKNAYEKITKANKLVFIGYSMPKTDAHFSYFLKSAFNSVENLPEIYVMDENVIVKENYDEIFNSYTFIEGNWMDLNNWKTMSKIL